MILLLTSCVKICVLSDSSSSSICSSLTSLPAGDRRGERGEERRGGERGEEGRGGERRSGEGRGGEERGGEERRGEERRGEGRLGYITTH